MFQELTDDLISLEELQQMLQVGRNTAYDLLRTGDIKAFRVGRIWKIPRASVTEYISRKSQLGFYNN